ncbi:MULTISPECIES: DUF1822 family protein [unclassified Nodularia (in: cyanobacteria)]|uniref:DUF1822 family protein n=1 Tax=unclassified Nodularia (in: cyanobacteria) TaxID=2656917 RepID=UPI00187FF262|nr:MULTISPECIES: DUF1822 family protein [unclassified Nodularia (in: cyanobacteria)]MBE9201162.1 DUF1822 family protein [Nodularia sp. LEGE 06071]MCC2693711.1 DUF1822 family protein [Nodularia sp. LEGE 04288]
MTANTPILSFASTDLILEIPTTVQNQVHLHSQSFAHSPSYQAYINELCLGAVLPWLQEDFTPQAKVWPDAAALPSFWELVNGTAIVVDATRLILVPSENIDGSELRIPQEWVDLSSWAGDYYLAVQVEPDDGYVRVWGYCTHEKLKTKGNYHPGDRTYALDADDLITDISVLNVAREFCADQVKRIATVHLPILPQAQAENLISRLGNPEIITPRLAVPFPLWGGLIAHGGWRQRLYEQRLGLPEQRSVIQWLQSGVSQIAAAMGWEKLNLQLSPAGARSIEERQPGVSLSRQLAIAGQLYELLITPQGQPDTTHWRFELRNATMGAAIPGGFKLRLLTEDLQPFPNNEDIATTAVEQLYIEVALEAGEGIVWEVEPLPDNYDREILKF